MLTARNEEQLASISGKLSAVGVDVAYCPCDVTEEESVSEMVRFVADRCGWPDLLVSNAGIPGPTAPAWGMSTQDWDEVLAANLTGPWLCSRAVIPAMTDRRSGHIVTVGSITGKRPLPSRFALVMRTLADEVGRYSVRVNAVSPGVVEGPRIEGVLAGQAAARGVSAEVVSAEFVQGLLRAGCAGTGVSETGKSRSAAPGGQMSDARVVASLSMG